MARRARADRLAVQDDVALRLELEAVDVLELVQPMVNDEQRRVDAEEEHAQVGPMPLKVLQTVEIRRVRQEGEAPRPHQCDAKG